MTELKIKRIEPKSKNDISLPQYMTEGSSGMDISAAITEPLTIKPMEIKLIPSGFSIELPAGYEAQIRPRSGLAVKHGITIINAPGTIDSDYRGEIKIGLINLGGNDFIVERGMRIAQMVISKVERVIVEEVDEIDKTRRNKGGFGHTGV
ncbi:MAG: dUTP diphosphatase [Deltaproteobacteria bacterium]|nr:MAG: dUTP diphosphatase [Deltaproteobacteria bacterium]